MREVALAKHHEDALRRRAFELGDEGDRRGDAVQHMTANDQIGPSHLGVLPGASDDGDVVAPRDMGSHALRGLDGGHPFHPLRQRDGVPAGAGSDVDHRLVRGEVGIEHLEELVHASVRRAGVARGAPIPVAGVDVTGRKSRPVLDDLPPARLPVDLVHRRFAVGF